MFNKTYIGLLSNRINNHHNNLISRYIHNRSFDYMFRLIENEPCGIVVYDETTQKFKEDFSERVTLYYSI